MIRGLANSSGTTHIVGPLSEEMARQGCKVSVFHVQKGTEPAVEPDPSLVESCRFALSLPFNNPGVSAEFWRALKSRIADFDVVHVHAVWNFPTWTAMRLARRAGVPYVVAPQGSFAPWALTENRWGKRVYGHLTELPLLKRADCLQALTETEKAQFREAGLSGPVEVVPNGVDVTHFDLEAAPLREQLGLGTNQKTLLFLSRLHPKKGLDILIDAFARLCRTRDDVTLVIAGHDAGNGFEGRVRSWIEERGLSDRCRLIGEVRDEAKYRTFRGADAFVLPSYSEGLPVAALEAMAARLPVVLTHRCNLPEVAHAGAGWVTEPNAGALAEALLALFQDPAAAAEAGANGRRLAEERFSWPGVAKRLLEIYRGLVAAGAPERVAAS